MNTGKQQTYTAVSVVIDAIVLTVSYVISYLIQFALQNNLAPFDSRNYWPPLDYCYKLSDAVCVLPYIWFVSHDRKKKRGSFNRQSKYYWCIDFICRILCNLKHRWLQLDCWLFTNDDFMDDHFKYNIYGCLEKYIPIHPDEAWKQPLQPKTSIDCRLQSGSRGLY